MRYLRLFVITLVISSMLVSCASFNYSETVNAVNKAAENGADINTLEELAEQYGLPPLEDAAESDSETQTPTVYTDAEVDIDDAEQWTELEVPPAEEESKSMEEAAVQPENGSDENQTEPTEQTEQTEQIEETEENRCVKYKALGIPLDANLWIQMLPVSSGGSKIRVTVKAEMNMMMKMMVGSKLKDGVNQFAEMIAGLPFQFM